MRDSLDRSILRVMLAYAATQLAIFTVFSLAGGFFLRYAPAFYATCLGFILFLFLMLRLFKKDFAHAETGIALERVNLANLITLFRVTSLPTLLFLVLAARDHPIRVPLLVLVVIVFLSDFADGWVSRKRAQVTRIGKMLDSTSDYAVLVVLTIVFYYFHLIRVWFFLLVMGRLAVQAGFMAALFATRGRVRVRTTFLGKAAIASIMVLYAAEILELVLPLGLGEVLRWLERAAAAVVAISVVDKVAVFVEDLRDVGKDQAGQAQAPGRKGDGTD